MHAQHPESTSSSTSIPVRVCVFVLLPLVIVAGIIGIVILNTTSWDDSSDTYDRPHIIFLLSDDLGFSDVGWNDPEASTPNLDELAHDGIILDRNYMQPVCTPSRAALLTGKYPFRVGIQNVALKPAYPVCLDLTEKLLPAYLKDQDYATHALGKWHLGFCNLECTPTFRGFDTFYGYYNGDVDWYTKIIDEGYDWRDGLASDRDAAGIYTTHLLRDRAVDIIDAHDPDTPLFMYLAFGTPHVPILVPPGVEEQPASYEGNRANYLSMVTDMDDSIGQIVEALKDNGLYDRTLIVFSSDNGATYGPGSNYPLRGAKGSVYEGGTRVPAFVHGPILSTRGIVSEETIHVSDWLPTLATIAGVEDDWASLDGVDQSDLVLNGGSSGRQEIIHNVNPYGRGTVRMGDYKLILGYPGSTDGWEQYDNVCATYEVDLLTGVNPNNCTVYQPPDFLYRALTPGHVAFVERVQDHVLLFNVVDDPTEEVDLSETMPDKVAEMRVRLEDLTSEISEIDSSLLQNVPEGSYEHFDGAWSYGFC